MSNEQFHTDLLRKIDRLEREVADLEGIELPAGALTVSIEDEGIDKGLAEILDFVGTGVVASEAGGKGTINVPTGGAGGGNNFVFLEEKIVTGDPVETIEFSSISSSYRHLFFFYSLKQDILEASGGVIFNGLNTQCYTGHLRFGPGMTAEKDWSYSRFSNFLSIIRTGSSASPADHFPIGWMLVPYYRDTDFTKHAWGSNFVATRVLGWNVGWYASLTAAVTSVTFRLRISGSGKFVVGSKITMYGIT